jgi:dTDP-4-amino-4,6-dideoxygalactose transaminase
MTMSQLARIDVDTQRRLAAAEIYFEALGGLPHVVLPPRPQSTRHIYTYFAIRCRRRSDLLKWLMYFGRDVAAQHLKNCSALPQFAGDGQECPVASRVAESFVLLPTYPAYAGEQAGITARIVAWYFQEEEPAFDRRAAGDRSAELLPPERSRTGAPRVPPARHLSTRRARPG